MNILDSALPTASQSNGVGFIRNDLAAMFPAYDLIEDCIGGSERVKSKYSLYLPKPNAPSDDANQQAQNNTRYIAYGQRAVFYNVTQRTLLGLQGQIFSREPVVKNPSLLDDVVTDSDGSGISLNQLARDCCLYNIAYGRGGLFVDYPPTTGPTTREQQKKGGIRPTIAVYGPKSVINWRTKKIGSRIILSLVVLLETYVVEDDGFETKIANQYRELRLGDDGRYSVQVWRAPKPDGSNFERYNESYYPTDGKGNFLDEIPFTFFGAKNNEPSIDSPPLYDLANINIAHYRNSADYEELVFIVGQPMLVITGLEKTWYQEVLGSNIPFGSRGGLALPADCTATLIQAAPNSLAKEAMDAKERQMVALGAKVVQQAEVQRTAKEAGLETSAEESTLVSVAKNCSAALQWALEWCAVFLNTSEDGIEYSLNTDFELARMDATGRAAIIKLWQDEAISRTEMRDNIRKSGLILQEDELSLAEIEKEQTAAIEHAAREIEASSTASNVGIE